MIDRNIIKNYLLDTSEVDINGEQWFANLPVEVVSLVGEYISQHHALSLDIIAQCATQNYLVLQEFYHNKIKEKKYRITTDFPTITVGVLTRNHHMFLPRALYSLFRQSYTNLEIVIMAHPDDIPHVYKQLRDVHDRRIRIITQRGEGEGDARAQVLEESQHEFVSYLQADDALTSDYFESVFPYLSTHDVVCAHSLTLHEKEIGLPSHLIHKEIPPQVWKVNDEHNIPGWLDGAVFHKEILHSHPYRNASLQHEYNCIRDLFVRLKKYNIYTIPKRCGQYSYHTSWCMQFSPVVEDLRNRK